MTPFVVEPYRLYPITTDAQRRPVRPLIYSPARLKRAHRASVGTNLAKALIARRFGK